MSVLVDLRFCRQLAKLGAGAAQAAIEASPIVSTAVAAKLSRRSPQVIRGAINQGSLPALGKHFKLVLLSDLQAWAGRTTPFTATELRGVGAAK
jgi:hypothetical protein